MKAGSQNLPLLFMTESLNSLYCSIWRIGALGIICGRELVFRIARAGIFPRSSVLGAWKWKWKGTQRGSKREPARGEKNKGITRGIAPCIYVTVLYVQKND